MQAVTLDVIMAGIFGVEGRHGAPRARPARRARGTALFVVRGCSLAELVSLGREELVGHPAALGKPVGSMRSLRPWTARGGHRAERTDILSLLEAETEDGERLTTRSCATGS